MRTWRAWRGFTGYLLDSFFTRLGIESMLMRYIIVTMVAILMEVANYINIAP